MSRLSFFHGVLAASLLAHQISAARMAAQVSAHRQLAGVVLSEQQQQLRKASQTEEASTICRKPQIKDTINADVEVEGVIDIDWDTVQKTSEAGLAKIEKDRQTLTTDIADLDQTIKELTEAGKWAEVPDEGMDEMLLAACQVDQLKSANGDFSRARQFKCGYDDYEMLEANDWNVPFDGPVEAFRAVATTKITGHNKLAVTRFKKHCSTTLPGKQCGFLCDAFSKIVKDLAKKESAVVLGNDALDDVIAKRKAKNAELVAVMAEKESCIASQAQLEAFRLQLGKLSDSYDDSKSAVRVFSGKLNSQKMRLRWQIKKLAEKKALLEKAKAVFAAASAQVEARQADVAHMEKVLEELGEKLRIQLELIEKLEQRIADIDAATETGRLFKVELSRTLANAVDYNTEAFHEPLRLLGVTPGRNIAQEFDAAEVAAAPAMKDTVRAVEEYCGSERASSALTSPLIALEGTTKELNFICVGQDWNNMITEAQDVAKKDAKSIVDILLGEQSAVVADGHTDTDSSLRLREASGEPKGLRHATAIYGGQSTFVSSYLNPGWTVGLNDGEVGEVGKMLMLYQKLGEAAELVNKNWEEAKKGAKDLQDQIAENLKELEKLQELLRQAIAAKEIAENKMNEAQQVVDENEKMKKVIEGEVETASDDLTKGEEAVDTVKDALLKEHRDRSAALLEIMQELQQMRK